MRLFWNLRTIEKLNIMEDFFIKSALVIFFGTFLFILITGSKLKDKIEYEKSQKFGINEINLSKIILSFLKLKKFNFNERTKVLTESFKTYSEKLFIEISENKIDKLVHNYFEKEINLRETCKKVSKLSTKHKLFLLYSLMDIAVFDQVYSNEEEAFINNIRRMIKIPIQTFNIIKSSYTKKGMKLEREIIEEQNRKKTAESFTKSFLPYNAYKILGVSPSVTKAQLKKVYRTLVKQYHPDKFHGQSNEIIQKSEDKFQEITEAYEIIKNFKNFN